MALSTGSSIRKIESEESVSRFNEDIDSAIVHRFGCGLSGFIWRNELSSLHSTHDLIRGGPELLFAETQKQRAQTLSGKSIEDIKISEAQLPKLKCKGGE